MKTAAEERAFPGAYMIVDERIRQKIEEGYTDTNDDEHDEGQLAEAARCYLEVALSEVTHVNYGNPTEEELWPWGSEEWKPADSSIGNLVKAGALIAAEIDRLRRAAMR